MAKKRYALYISRALASKFDLVAKQRHGSKSAMLEEALRLCLEPEKVPGVEEVLVRRLDELHKVVGIVNRDVAIITETLALFVRYFLMITPPLPESEQEAARLRGRERFQVFVAQVGRRLATDHRLVTEVLETITRNNPDLFATVADDAPLRGRAAGNGNGAHREVLAAIEPTDSKKDTGHG
ncbi:MAG: CopG family transcriptional regulator [Hyphomicrobium sp.]|nr:CopG family transcriptional regulator [Hyphomicrobium sp.]MBN9265184.1 CopG family transcriptional regulator [Hyphomicrobium sp.]